MDDKVDSNEQNTESKSSFMRLAGVTVLFTVFFAFSMVYADRPTVMANWAKERCRLPVMASAFLYKPSDYQGSALQFSQDNYNYCMKSYARTAMNVAAQPALNVIKSQTEATGTVQKLQNSVRNMLGNVQGSFTDLMGQFYNRYSAGRGQASRIFQYLRSGMYRIQGVIGAVIYTAISLYASMMNTIELIIYVIMIIMLILAVLFMFFFTAIPLYVFIGLITSTMVVISLMGFGHLIGGSACFADGTKVIDANGNIINIEDLTEGTKLLGGGIVEGMFVFDGNNTPLYNLYGIYVSETHLVFNDNTKTYMEVINHKDARLTDKRAKFIYCPIISSRNLTIKGDNDKHVVFSDWEEVSSERATDVWNNCVKSLLHVAESYEVSDEVAGFSSNSYVIMKNGNIQTMKNVKIGDYIMDRSGNGVTRVVGIVKRKTTIIPTDGPTRGTWIWNSESGWLQFSGVKYPNSIDDGEIETELYHLVTDSGTFTVYYNGKTMLVRDATEVGMKDIRSCAPYVLEELNRANRN
jgi:hypothetical protein